MLAQIWHVSKSPYFIVLRVPKNDLKIEKIVKKDSFL